AHPVRDAGTNDRCLEAVGSHDRQCRQEAAIRPSTDTGALWIDQTTLDERVHAPDDIVEVLTPKVGAIRVSEISSLARRTSWVGQQHRIAVGSQNLCPIVP